MVVLKRSYRDLEPKRAVQHCHCLVDFIGDEFTSTLVEVEKADCHRDHLVGDCPLLVLVPLRLLVAATLSVSLAYQLVISFA